MLAIYFLAFLHVTIENETFHVSVVHPHAHVSIHKKKKKKGRRISGVLFHNVFLNTSKQRPNVSDGPWTSAFAPFVSRALTTPFLVCSVHGETRQQQTPDCLKRSLIV